VTSMADPQIRFDDGAAYEQMMGVWSRLAGEVFLDWLAPAKGLRWVDVGCGNGAFTELLIARCAPVDVQGIDPSEGQLGYARKRPGASRAQFRQGDAMALPYADRSCDAATMALVIFFVPDPAKGVAEMARVVSPGGIVAAYAWDLPGGGFPLYPIQAELRVLGQKFPTPPSADASRIEALRDLWTGAGLESVETQEIAVQRSFPDFDAYWATSLLSPSTGATVAAMPAAEVERLKSRVRARIPSDAAGRLIYGARANAVKGRVP
jgi:SAM-dependent methyltransferase